MRAPVRRSFLFLAMVAAGLAVVFVFSDASGRPILARIGVLSSADSDAARLKILDKQSQEQVQVVFPGELEFDVLQDVELEPGRIEERPAYRVKIKSGRPDPSGAFLAEAPLVHLLDTRTGADNGTISAQRARFETGDAVGGSVNIDFAHLDTRRFSLQGDVRGELLMADGQVAHVACELVDVDGQLVNAPGFVSWSRDDMTLTGQDMTWDGNVGRLNFESDAHISLAQTPERRGLELDAPGGITWTLPPGARDPRTESWGELRGRVTGTASDGTHIEADTLLVDGRTGLLRLREGAVFERDVSGKRVRLSAQHIAVETDETGKFALAQADGAVRLVTAPFAVLPAWMVTEHIRMEGDEVRAPGQVTWSQEGVVASGSEMLWDTAIGRLDYERDAQLAVTEGSGQPLAGLRVSAPGGMTWIVPPEATDPVAQATGELRGKVTGTLPDGTTFSTDMLFFDGATRAFTLEGSAQFERLADDTLSSAQARRITLGAGADDRLALVSAEGDVVLLSGPLDVLPARLSSQRLDKLGADVTSPEVVTWTRDDLTIVGTGVHWNEDTGRLDFEKDALITYVDRQRDLTLELAAEHGLTWVVPKGASHALEDGHGELRGRVTGRTSDGSTLHSDKLLLDGPSRTVTLRGPSRVELAGQGAPLSVTSSEIVVESIDAQPKVSTDQPVQWSRGGMNGSGTGLRWDDATGRLNLQRHVRIEFAQLPLGAVGPAAGAAAGATSPGAADRQPFVLTSRGSLVWTVPPGSTDPLREGAGELRDGVEGGSDEAGRFHTDLLELDGAQGTARMVGPSSYQRRTPKDALSFAAQDSLVLRSAPDGTPVHVTATGGAQAHLLNLDATGAEDCASTLHLSGQSVEADRQERWAELRGYAVVEQGVGKHLRRITAVDHIRALTNDRDELRFVEAEGGVVCRLGLYEAHGDRLTWDVQDDVATLSGNCRLLAAGSVMEAALVEVHPQRQECRILRASLHVDP